MVEPLEAEVEPDDVLPPVLLPLSAVPVPVPPVVPLPVVVPLPAVEPVSVVVPLPAVEPLPELEDVSVAVPPLMPLPSM